VWAVTGIIEINITAVNKDAMTLSLCFEKKPTVFPKTLNSIPKGYNSKIAIDFALSLDVDVLHLFILSHSYNFYKIFCLSFVISLRQPGGTKQAGVKAFLLHTAVKFPACYFKGCSGGIGRIALAVLHDIHHDKNAVAKLNFRKGGFWGYRNGVNRNSRQLIIIAAAFSTLLFPNCFS